MTHNPNNAMFGENMFIYIPQVWHNPPVVKNDANRHRKHGPLGMSLPFEEGRLVKLWGLYPSIPIVAWSRWSNMIQRYPSFKEVVSTDFVRSISAAPGTFNCSKTATRERSPKKVTQHNKTKRFTISWPQLGWLQHNHVIYESRVQSNSCLLHTWSCTHMHHVALKKLRAICHAEALNWVCGRRHWQIKWWHVRADSRVRWRNE